MSTPSTSMSAVQRLSQRSDIYIGIAVIAIITMIVIPVPPVMLNLLLTLSFTASLVILLITLYAREPLSFSAFPSLIIITTVYRLSLNISTTRAILSQGYAGEVIEAFGSFVTAGNYVVGFVIFLIIIMVNYMVISHGAVRIGEVAARFTLDAMPGKQMAIDADLNAGLITEEQARQRRRNLEQEADFFGAMDGAARFVQRDALAGLIITAVNILAGMIIGMAQRGLDFQTALQTYTRLTIGDGLLSAIPALLVAVGTGMMVTNIASEENLGQDVSMQILSHPRALIVGSILLAAFAIIPGLPKLPFLIVAGAVYGLWGVLQRTQQKVAEEEEKKKTITGKPPESVVPLLHLDILELEIGYGLIPLVDVQQGGDLLDRITMMRRQIALELGLIVPPIRIRDNMQLSPNAYQIKLKGVVIARGEVIPNQFLAMHSGTPEEEVPGTETREPTYGLKAYWIHPTVKERAESLGYTVVDATSVIITHLSETVKSHAAEIVTRQDVQTLLDNLKQNYPVLVEELVPNILSLGDLQKVLQNLLKEKVPVRDMLTICEVLADRGKAIKDVDALTEHVRQALAATINQLYADREGKLKVLTLAPELEQFLQEHIETGPSGKNIFLDTKSAQALFQVVSEEVKKKLDEGITPAILCSAPIRLPLRRFLMGLPQVPVLSYNEIHEKTKVESLGSIKIE